jgi:hypothetical protein
MSNIPKDHVSKVTNDGNLIKVSTTTLMTRENVHVLEPRGVDGRLDPQRGKAQFQVLPTIILCFGGHNFQPNNIYS